MTRLRLEVNGVAIDWRALPELLAAVRAVTSAASVYQHNHAVDRLRQAYARLTAVVNVPALTEEAMMPTPLKQGEWRLSCPCCSFYAAPMTAMKPLCPACGARLLLTTTGKAFEVTETNAAFLPEAQAGEQP